MKGAGPIGIGFFIFATEAGFGSAKRAGSPAAVKGGVFGGVLPNYYDDRVQRQRPYRFLNLFPPQTSQWGM